MRYKSELTYASCSRRARPYAVFMATITTSRSVTPELALDGYTIENTLAACRVIFKLQVKSGTKNGGIAMEIP
jgi:hypothetical protein